MSYLLYCIFRSGRLPQPELPNGIYGRPVLVMERGALGAGVSDLRQLDPHPDVVTVLAYENVVEYFFRQQSIIPMRYGCTIRDTIELNSVLDKYQDQFDKLLARLEGLVEMGIEVQTDGQVTGPELVSAVAPQVGAGDTGQSGASYLFARKLHYGNADQVAEQRTGLVTTVCQPLSGLFVHHKVELSASQPHGLSIYFLVPRSSVEAFRQASRCCPDVGPSKLVVSGPWPPYNFVYVSEIRAVSQSV